MDASFDFSFFLGRPDITGHRNDLERSQKIQERVVETDHAPTTFGHGSQHIIDNDLFRRCAEKIKGVQERLMEDLLSLAVGKLDIKHPAVRFYDRQSIELSLSHPIRKSIEVAPVNLHLFARSGFEADKDRPVFQCLLPVFPKIIPDNRDSAIKSLFLNPLKNHGSVQEGVLFQKRVDQAAIGIQLGNLGFLPGNGGFRVLQVFFNSVPAEPHLSGNLPCRIPCISKPVDLEDCFSVNHGRTSGKDCRIIRATTAGSSSGVDCPQLG